MGSVLAVGAAVAASITAIAERGPLFCVYYVFCRAYLWATRRLWGRRLDLYDTSVDGQPEKTGFVIPHQEWQLEIPKENASLRKVCDDVFLYGVNSKSDSLAVHVSRKPNGYVLCSLHMRLANGKIYKLPEEHVLQKETEEPHTFGSARFKVQCLIPFVKWRIFFNGTVREVTEGQVDVTPIYKHMSFTFIWTASSEVFDYNDDMSAKVIATAASSPSSLMSSPLFILKRMRRIFDSYEQPGMILGTFKIGNEEQELYLWGIRGRYKGSKEFVKDSGILQIYGTLKTGATIHLESRHIPGVASRFLFGYVQKSNGFIHPIEECKEILAEGKLRFSFICDDDKCLLDVKKNLFPISKFEKEFGGNMLIEQSEIVMNGVSGKSFIFRGWIKEPTKLSLPKVKLSFAKQCGHSSSMVPLCVSFQDPCCENSSLTGGKGSSLGKLYSLSKEKELAHKSTRFEIPMGVVVTTESYKEFIKGGLETAIRIFEKKIWCDVEADVSSLCKRISEKVSKASIPEKVVDSVIQELQLSFGARWMETKFAVRSSATGEDTMQMSAAGQMETFLGLKGKEEILNAIRKCWASQFSFHPIQYKRRYGQLLNMPMAVVIQQMIPCEAAGVIFTCDPVTGNPEFLSLSANWGLGESVVSASAEPDTIVIRRDISNKLTYHSEVIGQKKSKIVMDSDSGTKEVEIEQQPAQCCLSKDMALNLAEISVQIEDYFGNARDIEWGITSGKIYLFQSRPVTSLDVDTEFESKHFFDSFLRAENEYVTKANVGEVLPGAASPLSIDYMQRNMFACTLRQWFNSWASDTGPEVPYFAKVVTYAYNHTFIGMIDGFMRFCDETSDFSKAMMIALLGRIVDEQKVITQMSVERHRGKGQPLLQRTVLSAHLLFLMFGANMYIKAAAKELKSLSIPFWTKRTASQVFNLIGCTYTLFHRGFNCHFGSTVSTSNWNLLLITMLAKAKGTFDNDVYSDFAYLLSTCTELESADVPAAIQNLGYAIAKCIEPQVFKDMSVKEALNWLQNTNSEAGIKFRKFLEVHGHRCLKEFDIFVKPWGMEPEQVIKMLQPIVTADIKSAEVKKPVPFSTILSHLHVKLDFLSRLKLRLLLPNCRRAVREREASKSVMIKCVNEVRKPFHRLAELMVEEGRLPKKELLFFLCVEEVNQLIKTRSPRIVARAQKRYGYHAELNSLRFPEIVCGIPKPINIEEEYESATEGTVMTGFPVSQGVVKAPARVVPEIKDAVNIKPGDVLITYSTDIGWSPYFPLLSGIVTELGGLVSHGAVVAREYGLPCVVGLHGATQVFQSGDIVVLDGTKGTIKKVGRE